MRRTHRFVALVVVACLAQGCSFQLGRPVRAPTQRVLGEEERETPSPETESVFAEDATRLRVEAHRLCSVVHTRTIERRTELDRTATREAAAKSLIVIGVALTLAGVVGFVRPELLSNASKSHVSPQTSRILGGIGLGVGSSFAIGGAAPLLAARRPEVQIDRSTVEDPPSPPRRCAASVDDSGITIELALDDRRIELGHTDASGVVEVALDGLVPRDFFGTAHLVVDGTVGDDAIDLANLHDRRVASAITSCRAGDEDDCSFLARARDARVATSRSAELSDALVEHDWRALDLARCESARSSVDCSAIATFLAWHPNDPRAEEARERIRRGRKHAIEVIRATFAR